MDERSDRRRYPRLPGKLITRLESHQLPRTQVSTTTKDICLGGVRVVVAGSRFKAKDAVRLDFAVPVMGRNTLIEAVAIVAWTGKDEVGLEFKSLTSHPRDALVEYLQVMERADQAEAALRELPQDLPPPH